MSRIFLFLPRLLVITFLLCLFTSPLSALPGIKVSTVHAFDGKHGFYPAAALILGKDGRLYGTTVYGGGNYNPQYIFSGYGTVYRVDPDTHKFETVFAFDGFNGGYPEGIHQGTDGALYGVTTFGGGKDQYGNVAGGGTVFRLSADGKMTILHRFAKIPYPALANEGGGVPIGAPVQTEDGILYGTTVGGGMHGRGIAYKIAPDNSFTVLHSFRGTEGEYPRGGMVQGIDGSFYGMTSGGGKYGKGTIYVMTLDGTVRNLHSFDITNGSTPNGELIFGTDGALYGSTPFGGIVTDLQYGVLFRITTDGTFTTLHKFSPYRDGYHPVGLTLGPDGNFYGATNEGGAPHSPGSHGAGTLFRMTPQGGVTTLYKFGLFHGAHPMVSLTFDSEGALYGTTGGSFSGDASYSFLIFKATLPQ